MGGAIAGVAVQTTSKKPETGLRTEILVTVPGE